MVVKGIALNLVLASSLVTGVLVAETQTIAQQSEDDFVIIPCATNEPLEQTAQQDSPSCLHEKETGDVNIDDLFFDDMSELDFDNIDLNDLRSIEASNPQTMPLSVQLKLAALYLNSCKDDALVHVANNRNAYIYGIIACAALGAVAYVVIKKKAQ